MAEVAHSLTEVRTWAGMMNQDREPCTMRAALGIAPVSCLLVECLV